MRPEGRKAFLVAIGLWGLLGIGADLLARKTSLLGPDDWRGLRVAHPLVWVGWVAALAALMGYDAIQRAKYYRGAIGLVTVCFYFVILGGALVLKEAAWWLTWISLFLCLIVVDFLASRRSKAEASLNRKP